ncbi:hypothetical protein BT69DRAFT_1275834 [Atractiella rhizophila]|nr:hypothetical protein BT69DRAFT_1275834 [Atractiella rhizophila]
MPRTFQRSSTAPALRFGKLDAPFTYVNPPLPTTATANASQAPSTTPDVETRGSFQRAASQGIPPEDAQRLKFMSNLVALMPFRDEKEESGYRQFTSEELDPPNGGRTHIYRSVPSRELAPLSDITTSNGPAALPPSPNPEVADIDLDGSPIPTGSGAQEEDGFDIDEVYGEKKLESISEIQEDEFDLSAIPSIEHNTHPTLDTSEAGSPRPEDPYSGVAHSRRSGGFRSSQTAPGHVFDASRDVRARQQRKEHIEKVEKWQTINFFEGAEF